MKAHIKITLMMFIYMLIVITILPLYNLPADIIEKKIELMQDSWTVSYDGRSYNNVSVNRLKDAAISRIKKGDSIRFSKELSFDGSYEQPALLISSNCASVSVFLDGESIYSQRRNASSLFLYVPGKEFHLIEIPTDFSSKTLTIEFTAEEDLAFSGIIPPLFGERLLLVRLVVYRGLRSLLMGIFMSIYGILFVIISAFFSKKVPQIQGQVYVAAICILIGVWMVCYNEAFILLYPGVNTALLEYACQFLSVPLFYVFLFRLNLPIRNSFEKRIAIALSISSFFIIALWLVLRNYSSLLMLFFIIILAVGLMIIARYYNSIRKIRNFDNSVFMQISGISVMMLACLLQCILYYMEDFRGIPRGVFSRNVMSVGVSTLVVSQMLNFFFLVTRDVAGQTGDVPLTQMAYHDNLTGIFNRSKAEEITQKVLHSDDAFCIIIMDLNGLKSINDHNGHLSGDHLLIEFAQVLRVCIRKNAFYARIGGDEFIAIIENPAPNQARELVDLIRAGFDKLDRNEPDVKHSFSAGYATSYEAETIYNIDGRDRDKVWKFTMKLADSRMYEQKAAMKANLDMK